MATITKELRGDIAFEATALAFKARVEKWCKQDHALMQAVIDRAYPPKLREAMEALEQVSKKTYAAESPFSTRQGFNVTVGGCQMPVGRPNHHYHNYVWRDEFGYTMKDVKILKFHDNGYIVQLLADDKLGVKIVAHREVREALTNEIEAAICEVKAALTNIRTDKQCRAQWPEIMPIVEKLIPEAKAATQLPAVQRDDLNARLNLPPKDYTLRPNDNAAMALAA